MIGKPLINLGETLLLGDVTWEVSWLCFGLKSINLFLLLYFLSGFFFFAEDEELGDRYSTAVAAVKNNRNYTTEKGKHDKKIFLYSSFIHNFNEKFFFSNRRWKNWNLFTPPPQKKRKLLNQK